MIPAPGRDAAAAAVRWNIDKKGKTGWTETYEWTIQDLSSNSETKQVNKMSNVQHEDVTTNNPQFDPTVKQYSSLYSLQPESNKTSNYPSLSSALIHYTTLQTYKHFI